MRGCVYSTVFEQLAYIDYVTVGVCVYAVQGECQYQLDGIQTVG